MNAMQEAMKVAFANNPPKPHTDVTCPYCGKPAVLVGGDVIYPHREDLYSKKFWNCAPCKAYVGCHPVNPTHGQDGTRPLGRLADADLRRAKSAAHRVFDPLWQEGHFKSRKAAYSWLAGQLHIPVDQCHIGFFNVARCNQVVVLCHSFIKGVSK